jgi:hypothetical protein
MVLIFNQFHEIVSFDLSRRHFAEDSLGTFHFFMLNRASSRDD